MDTEKIKIGMEIIRSYEQWGIWLVSLSVTAIGALSIRHGIKAEKRIPRLAFFEFVSVGSLLFLASAASAYLIGNLKYVRVKVASGDIDSLNQIPKVILNEALPGVTVLQASAFAGIVFWAGAFVFILFEVLVLWRRSKE